MNRSPSGPDWQDIARGARVNFLGILARSFRAVYLILVARLFGAEVLGLYLLSWGVVDLLSKAGLFGLDRAVVRFVSPGDSGPRRNARLTEILRLAVPTTVLTALGAYLLAPTLARVVLDQPAAVPPLRILAWGIVPLVLTSVLLAITRVERRMQYEVWTKSVVEPVLLLLGAVALAEVGEDGTGLYLAQLAALVGGFVAAVLIVRRLRLVRLSPLLTKPTHQAGSALGLRPLVAFALPIAIYDLIAIGVMSLDFFMLARFVSPLELGVYGAAVQVAIVVKKARQGFEPILIPVLAQQLQRGDTCLARDGLDRVSRHILSIDVGFLLLVTVFGSEILRLFGDGFEAGATVLVLLTLAHSINGFWGFAENVAMLRRPQWNLWIWLAAAPVAVAVYGSVIPRFGAVGAAGGAVMIVLGIVGARLWHAKRLVGWSPSWRDAGWAFGLAGLIGTVTYGLKVNGPDVIIYRVCLGAAMVAVYAWAARARLNRPAVGHQTNGV